MALSTQDFHALSTTLYNMVAHSALSDGTENIGHCGFVQWSSTALAATAKHLEASSIIGTRKTPLIAR